MKRRGLSFLELVFAIGLLFIGAGAIMSILIAGAAWPTRVRQAAERDNLAKQQIQRILHGQSAPVASPYGPIPGEPRYELRVQVEPADFEADASILTVSVRGPIPGSTVSTLRGVYTVPSGALLLTQYGCTTCHSMGTAAPLSTGPSLARGSLLANSQARNAALGSALDLDGYIEESIRNPASYLVPGYAAEMTSYPDINSMPQEDLNAIRQYLKNL